MFMISVSLATTITPNYTTVSTLSGDDRERLNLVLLLVVNGILLMLGAFVVLLLLTCQCLYPSIVKYAKKNGYDFKAGKIDKVDCALAPRMGPRFRP
ncbi:unnamed protein product [Bursaphelenchus xylophilus]|uniref:(pine wood nematode) hypothetical protein n=1 Tax=Bursaphelenchus xylophilus TaxID=6326 RepID=A0A1I7STH9_BURXY|nr:unnamed protein product [Bursaphelenchus xylophilus]CAG9108396.1 unnamed protein product [Bursaphelenchus xylophilus]